MLEYSREMIDAMVDHPSFDELYAFESNQEAEWKITMNGSIMGHYAWSGEFGVFYVKNRDYMNVAGILPDTKNMHHYYLAFVVFKREDIESIEDAYYELMSKAFTSIKTNNAVMCREVFDRIKDIVTNPMKIYPKGVLQKFYSDLIEISQHLSDGNYAINITGEHTHDVLRNIGVTLPYPDGTPRVIMDDDAIIVQTISVTDRLTVINIIPKYYEDKDNDSIRFKVLYDPRNRYEMVNAEEQLREAIRTCIAEEIYQMHEDAYNIVSGIFRHFEYDSGFIEIYFNAILMLAEHLAEGYKVTYGNNTEEAL